MHLFFPVEAPIRQILLTLQDILSYTIHRTYPLSETPAALGYVGEGHARGKVVITV